MIDLRSDTVTKPTEGMLQAMMQAEVGDDVFEEDPTVNAFQDKIAVMFGMEAGLFTPSGVMSNQLAVKVLTSPGEEIIMEETGHVFNYEASAAALISGVQIHPVPGNKGKIRPEAIKNAMRLGKDWEPWPSLVVIENTTNKGGGACYTRPELEDLRITCSELDLNLHLDGARIWNAIVSTNIDSKFFGSIADTITVSFSKGLGAPAGSMLLSSEENIRRARRFRKMLGGGMRQIGLLAAAADYGIEHHRDLLEEDHRRARELARAISECGGLEIELETVETNILIFDVMNGSAAEAVQALGQEGIQMVQFGPKTLRATFHLDINDEALEKTKEVVKKLFG